MKTTSLFIAMIAIFFLVGCGKEEKSSNSGAVSGAVVACPLGSTLQGGVCIGANGTVTQPGVNPNTGVGTMARFYSENWSARNLNITGAGYTSFIQKSMGVCGPWTMDPDCGLWVSGAFDVVLLADNVQANQLTAVFRLKRRGDGPRIAPRVVPLNFTLSMTNNNQGFEARAYGDFNSLANRSLVQIQVASGKLQDTFFDYRIAFRGEIIITGRFQKCSTADCGLSSNIGM